MARRLAAIMYTDIAGYAAMAQTDTTGALPPLQAQDRLAPPNLGDHRSRRSKSTKRASSHILTVGVALLSLLGGGLSVAGHSVVPQQHTSLSGSRYFSTPAPSSVREGQPDSHVSNAPRNLESASRGPSLGNDGKFTVTPDAFVDPAIDTSKLLNGTFVGGNILSGNGLSLEGPIYVRPIGNQYIDSTGVNPGGGSPRISDDGRPAGGLTGEVVGSVPVGAEPNGVAYDSATGYVYVSNCDSDNVTVINGMTDTVAGSVSAGYCPAGVAYDIRNGYLYAANFASPTVTVIDGWTEKAVGYVPIWTGTDAVAFDTRNGYVYVADFDQDAVSVIDGVSGSVVRIIPVGLTPDAIACDSANGYVYVANGGYAGEPFSNVTVINGATDRTVGSIPLGVNLNAVAYDSSNGNVYVVNGGSDDVSVISGQTDDVVATVPVGSDPNAVTYDSLNGYLYVSNGASDNVTAINGATDAVVGSIPVGNSPDAAAYDNANGYVYVANWASDSVSILNPPTPTYQVTFTESGLPLDTEWFVNVTGRASHDTVTDTITSNESNGTFVYTVATTNPEYWAVGGWFAVNGAAISESVVFTEVEYPVTFKESGLRIGTAWSVTLGSGALSKSTSTRTITFGEPNGSYNFNVSSPGWQPRPSNGSVTVDGSGNFTPISFARVTYALTFTESVLPSGTEWWVNVTGEPSHNSATATIMSSLPNGSYTFTVGSANKSYLAAGGSFTVEGASMPVPVMFSLMEYPVTFSETGLPSRTNWSVIVEGVPHYSTGIIIALPASNGSYAFTIGAVLGYSVNQSSGTLTVNGNGVVVLLEFNSTSKSERILGLPLVEGYTMVALIVAAVTLSILVATLFARRRRGNSIAVPSPSPVPPRNS